MGKLGHLLDLGQYFTHVLSSVSKIHIFEGFELWPTLMGSDQTHMSPQFGLQI